jgi:catechol 2,3-dioxygenase-like lactoylglutathione lyase family enzyme
MAVELNHTIVSARDREASARFLSEILGLPPARPAGHFLAVDLANGVSLDLCQTDGPIEPQHYAFLVSEAEFEQILGRIRGRGLAHWADPGRQRPGEIYRIEGARGVYFEDPSGHFLEALTGPRRAG